jgi:hypothetical protein
MDKKEFIFPGVILGLVLIIAAGLLLTQGRETTPPLSTSDTASSTVATTTANATTTPPSAPAHYYPYGSVTLSLNQPAGFKSGVSIRPISVITDSRCPAGVYCIQAGTVSISLKTTSSGTSATHTMSVGDYITVDGTTITFTSVQPMKTKNPISASQYRFTFTVEPTTSAQGPCYVGGCSSELCTDTKNQVSACLYSPSYACYRTATCERQPDGKCGWTQTPALSKCLANPPTA